VELLVRTTQAEGAQNTLVILVDGNEVARDGHTGTTVKATPVARASR
jgi:hypothetical protein